MRSVGGLRSTSQAAERGLGETSKRFSGAGIRARTTIRPRRLARTFPELCSQLWLIAIGSLAAAGPLGEILDAADEGHQPLPLER